MNKSQTFGFDLLMIIIGVVFFSELIYTSFFNFPADYFFQRNIENHELLRSALMFNNSLSYLDCALSFNSSGCRIAFNNSVEYALKSYLEERKYLLSVCGIYNNDIEGLRFKKAIPYFLNLTLSNGYCEIYFSIYSNKEVEGFA